MTSARQERPPEVAAPIPRFLTDHAGTRGLRRATRFSRPPATGRLGESFHVAAERNAMQVVSFDRPADIEPSGSLRWEYAAWAALVDEVAGWLVAAGAEPWDRVAIVKANHFDVLALCSAAARIGAVPAPMAASHSPSVMRTLLNRLERPLVVTDRERLIACTLDAETVKALTKRTLCVDPVDDRPDVVELDKLRGAPIPAVRLRADDEPMVIPHTSGTTGVPKLVIHSARSIHAQSHVETERWPFVRVRADERIAFCHPYFHTRVQWAVADIATLAPRVLAIADPSPSAVRRRIADFGPTLVETLPNIYLHWEQLSREPTRAFRNVRTYVNGFDAIPTRVVRAFLNASERRLPIWLQAWSQSECGAVAVRPFTRSMVRRIGRRPTLTQNMGWPQPRIGKLRAVDPATGDVLRRGQPGLIELSLPGRCLGYVGEQHRHELKTKGRWWNTGDMGVIDRSGAVRLLDREVDRVPGSSTIEIEDVLLDRLPQLNEAIVLGVPDSEPIPVVSTFGDSPIDDELWDAAVTDLPRLRRPVRIGWDDFPRTATWKVKRNDLRERLFDAEAPGIGRWT